MLLLQLKTVLFPQYYRLEQLKQALATSNDHFYVNRLLSNIFVFSCILTFPYSFFL
jgi:hypothetical protein